MPRGEVITRNIEKTVRTAETTRKTAETDIFVSINLDGEGMFEGASGNGFFDHMLTLFTRHSGFDLVMKAAGDTEVDFHHSAEDIGIALGKAIKDALDDCRGIARFADITLPMDEALVTVALDISGRAYLSFGLPQLTSTVGEFDTELAEEFFSALVREAGLTLHIKLVSGKNTHHIIEAVFKAFGRVLGAGVKVVSDRIPSTKGVI